MVNHTDDDDVILTAVCFVGYRASSGGVPAWQQEYTRSDADLEVNGLRAETAYVVQPMDCGGTVIPAYMDIDDARWADDPRVQRWRRETELGRMPRRETPRTLPSRAPAPPQRIVVRDPRLKTDATMSKSQASTASQQQQQQLVHSSSLASITAAGPVTTTLPQLPHLTAGVSLPPGTVQPNQSVIVPPVSVSVESLVPDVVPSSKVAVSSAASEVQDVLRAPATSVSVSNGEKPATASRLLPGDDGESRSADKPRANPHFKRRKSRSSHNSTKSALPTSSSTQSTSESARTETGPAGRDELLFQSPLAAADHARPSPASSGYNRPPNKRYQELLEQPSRDRYSGFGSARAKQLSDSRQLEKPSSVLSTRVDTVAAYPGIMSQDPLSSNSLAKGSLKDMFKTIDPTASPFC